METNPQADALASDWQASTAKTACHAYETVWQHGPNLHPRVLAPGLPNPLIPSTERHRCRSRKVVDADTETDRDRDRDGDTDRDRDGDRHVEYR